MSHSVFFVITLTMGGGRHKIEIRKSAYRNSYKGTVKKINVGGIDEKNYGVKGCLVDNTHKF